AEDGIRDRTVTGVQTCALPISFSLSKNFSRRHDAAEKAPFFALLRGHEATGIEQLGSAGLPDDPRQDRAGAHVATGKSHLVEQRSEERRVGKECGCRRSAEQEK